MRASRCQGKERHGPCRLARCLSWHRGPACARVLCSRQAPCCPEAWMPSQRRRHLPEPSGWCGGASSALLNGALHACGDVPPGRHWPPCPVRPLRRPCGRAPSDPACPGARRLSRAAGPQPAVGSCPLQGPASRPAEHLGTERPPAMEGRPSLADLHLQATQKLLQPRAPPRSPPCLPAPASFRSLTAGLPSLPPTPHPPAVLPVNTVNTPPPLHL